MGEGEKVRWMVPSRRCLACGEVFIWRKEWACCWHRIAYCGDDCRAKGPKKVEGLGVGSGLEESSHVEC